MASPSDLGGGMQLNFHFGIDVWSEGSNTERAYERTTAEFGI